MISIWFLPCLFLIKQGNGMRENAPNLASGNEEWPLVGGETSEPVPALQTRALFDMGKYWGKTKTSPPESQQNGYRNGNGNGNGYRNGNGRNGNGYRNGNGHSNGLFGNAVAASLRRSGSVRSKLCDKLRKVKSSVGKEVSRHVSRVSTPLSLSRAGSSRHYPGYVQGHRTPRPRDAANEYQLKGIWRTPDPSVRGNGDTPYSSIHAPIERGWAAQVCEDRNTQIKSWLGEICPREQVPPGESSSQKSSPAGSPARKSSPRKSPSQKSSPRKSPNSTESNLPARINSWIRELEAGERKSPRSSSEKSEPRQEMVVGSAEWEEMAQDDLVARLHQWKKECCPDGMTLSPPQRRRPGGRQVSPEEYLAETIQGWKEDFCPNRPFPPQLMPSSSLKLRRRPFDDSPSRTRDWVKSSRKSIRSRFGF